jgi:hypothetical protein
MPGRPGSCGGFLPSLPSTLTGTLSGGNWTGNGIGQHQITWNNGPGLLWHAGTGFMHWTWRGTFVDDQQTLVVNP